MFQVRRAVVLAVLATALLVGPARPAPGACVGDCDGDGSVTVDELLRGVNIALEIVPISACPALDANGDGAVTVNELLNGVNNALNGCPATPTPTATATETATPTATPRPNQAPLVSCFNLYRTYPGYPIRVVLDAMDPDGDALHYASTTLPAGAQLDASSGVLTWIPSGDQVGPNYVTFTVTDEADLPLSTDGMIAFEVEPLDACTQPTCDPASGCQTTLPALDQPCCQAPSVTHPGEAMAGCPYGRVMFVGRNVSSGFGRLRNCDTMTATHSEQVSAKVQFNVEARCLNTSKPVRVHAVMETKDRLVFDKVPEVILQARDDGYFQRRAISLSVNGPGPFFNLEGAEANFSVTLTDDDGFSATERLRVILTFEAVDDLPDIADPAPSLAVCPAQPVSSTPTGLQHQIRTQ